MKMRNLSLTRRTFFRGMAILTGGLFSYSLGGATGSITQQDFAENIRHIFKKSGYVFPPISRYFLDIHSSTFELQKKLQLTLYSDQTQGSLDINKASNLGVDQDKLFSVISSDFRDGLIVNINGWYISNTEYLILSYLSRVA